MPEAQRLAHARRDLECVGGSNATLAKRCRFCQYCALIAAAWPASRGSDVKTGVVDGEKVVQPYKGYKDAETQSKKQRDA